jgi:hypothetical protein
VAGLVPRPPGGRIISVSIWKWNYSPQARGRSERAFGTHQGRQPQELARQGIDTLEAANRYLAEEYLPRFNAEFAVPALEEGSAFVPWAGGETLQEILCKHHERTVGSDNCVRFEGLTLQIPVDRRHCHYVKAKVSVHRYPDGTLSIFHGPRRLAEYSADGRLPTTQVLLKVLVMPESLRAGGPAAGSTYFGVAAFGFNVDVG